MKQLVLLLGILLCSITGICEGGSSTDIQSVVLEDQLESEVQRVLSEELPLKKQSDLNSIASKPNAKVIVMSKDNSKLSEDEIPVLGLFGLTLGMFTKWWKKRTEKSMDTNKIRIMTQHFLGPRKSLAIVRVAGESILIGITDQNINMLKSLSLLDEDGLDEVSNTGSFEKALQSQVVRR